MSANLSIPAQAEYAPRREVATGAGGTSEVKRFLKNGALFLAGAVVLYLIVYVAAEQLNYRNTQKNRFLIIKTAPQPKYDYVILGASHAVAFDFEDMNARLEEMSGSKTMNLATVGAGIVPNRLLLDYFLAGHETDNIVYVVDSFGFYSAAWNEERVQDTGLYQRAPFDPTLAIMLINNPATRAIAPDYVLGFSKINNADRFKTDISDDEATRFAKTYRPVKQIDAQRLDYLYPKQPDPQVMAKYMAALEALLQLAPQRGIRVVVIKPPVPERWYKVLPNEAQFDQALSEVLQRNNVEFHDFSLVGNEEKFFYNTDHLNRAGVLNFFENYLQDLVRPDPAKVGGLVP